MDVASDSINITLNSTVWFIVVVAATPHTVNIRAIADSSKHSNTFVQLVSLVLQVYNEIHIRG